MHDRLRVCFWVTSLQSDIQALAQYLGTQPDFEVTIALDHPEQYAREAVNRLLPIRAHLVDREKQSTVLELAKAGFDLVVVDNHLPAKRLAPRLLVLWHGFGWRVDDLTSMRKELKALVGDVTQANPGFRWQAFGEWDRRYRIEHSLLAPANVVSLGSAYSDLLLPGSAVREAFDPRAVRDAYPLDVASRRNVLLGLTWHHGGALAQWGREPDLLRHLFAHAASRGANVVVRMHDRHRYAPDYLADLEQAVQEHDNVCIRYKSDHPDSLVDLLLADVLVSNYSSLLNTFYYTRRPSVHLDPQGAGQKEFVYRRLRRGRVREERVQSTADLWKLDAGEIGGLRARSFDEALAAIDRGLDQPECCADLAQAFTDRYVTDANGHSRERIVRFLRLWLAGANPPG